MAQSVPSPQIVSVRGKEHITTDRGENVNVHFAHLEFYTLTNEAGQLSGPCKLRTVNAFINFKPVQRFQYRSNVTSFSLGSVSARAKKF